MEPFVTKVNDVDVVIEMNITDDSLDLKISYDKAQAREKNVTEDDIETAIKKLLG